MAFIHIRATPELYLYQLGSGSRWEKSRVKRDGPVFFSPDPVKVEGDENAIIVIVALHRGEAGSPDTWYMTPDTFPPTGSSVTLVQDLRWICRDLR